MVLSIQDDRSGTTLELYNAQTLTEERTGEVEASPPTGFDSDQTFLSSLEQSGTVPIQGAVTGRRIAGTAGFNTDPQTALAEWAAQLEAFVDGQPGDGQTLVRDYRNDQLSGVVTTLQWTRRGGEPLELGYTLTLQRGESVASYSTPAADEVSPTGTTTVAGRTLDTYREFQSELSIPTTVTRRSFATTPDDNDITVDAGVTRSITITGQVAGDAATRNQFDADITASLGQDQFITIEDGFTGRTYDGMVTAYEPTDEAGGTRLSEFGIEFVEGNPQTASGEASVL